MSTTSPRRARTTLAAGAYTDSAWFAAEGDRIFARMWLAVGRAPELGPAGAFITRDIAGASVIVVRGADGRLTAFHNVCRHRGTRLCVTDAGTFAGSIQCPYHAWTYGLDGALLGAPQMDEARVLGPHQSRRLGHLGAVVPGHQLTRLPAVDKIKGDQEIKSADTQKS